MVGKLLAAPIRAGEPLTDVRVLSTALLSATGPPGDVAVPVRVADGPAALALVRAGDLIDILAAADPDDGEPATTTTVVRGVRVLAAPARLGDGSGGSDATAGLIIVEATSQQAAALAEASTGARLSVALRRQP
jgi:Flp pilus assembly protein CpaB